MGNIASSKSSSSFPPLVTVPKCETEKYMGVWFVIGVKPTFVEKTCSNAVEKYTRIQGSHDVDIDFKMNKADPITSPLKSYPQKGWIQGSNKDNSPRWKVSPLWPIKMPYQIIELDDVDYQYCVIGYPSREYVWIMARTPQMDDNMYQKLCDALKTKHQYSLEGLRKVPQKWTKDERAKRGLENYIPDSMLVDR